MPAASSDDRHTSPPLLLRRLGGELRRLREEVGLTTDQVVSGLYCSPSKISRLETGRVRASFRDVRDILDLYRVPEQQRASLYQLADEARQRDRWWHSRRDVPDVRTFIELRASHEFHTDLRILGHSGTAAGRGICTVDHPNAPARSQ